jgi:predicted RNase H-like HicB family nuclease
VRDTQEAEHRRCGTYRCAAGGTTYKEALADVEIIIQEWIETAKELGRPIPAPRNRLAFA